MDLLYILFFTAVALCLLVGFHEWGHYFVARRCGVRVERFSIGFGKVLLRWRRGDTEFAISAIPLGGYVKMFGEVADGQMGEAERQCSFAHKPPWQRMAVAAAGPLANLLLAVLLYWIVFLGGHSSLAAIVAEPRQDSPAAHAGIMQGDRIMEVDGVPVNSWREAYLRLVRRVGGTGELLLAVRQTGDSRSRDARISIDNWLDGSATADPMEALGLDLDWPGGPQIITEVAEDSPAQRAGLLPGDTVVAVDGEPLQSLDAWHTQIAATPGTAQTLSVERPGVDDVLESQLVPEAVEVDGQSRGRAGIASRPVHLPTHLLQRHSYGILGSAGRAVQKTGQDISLILNAMGRMVMGALSLDAISGPVTIARYAGYTAQAGWQSFLGFMAILSISLAVFNLLPIPVLDGGHLLFHGYEAITGKPVRPGVQVLAMILGIILLAAIMMLAIWNDISRLLGL